MSTRKFFCNQSKLLNGQVDKSVSVKILFVCSVSTPCVFVVVCRVQGCEYVHVKGGVMTQATQTELFSPMCLV